MANGGQKRTRSQRVASIELPPNRWERSLEYLRHGSVLMRIGLALLAGVIMWGLISGWAPPFSYRTGYIPSRDIIARLDFRRPQKENEELANEKEKARNAVQYVYSQDATPLINMRGALRNKVVAMRDAAKVEELDSEIWNEFLLPGEKRPDAEELSRMREDLANDEKLDSFESALKHAFADIEKNGILKELKQGHDQGNQFVIQVHPKGDAKWPIAVKLVDVQSGEAIAQLKNRLRKEPEIAPPEVFDRVVAWLEPKLKNLNTLDIDEELTNKEKDDAAARVVKQEVRHEKGKPLAKAGQPLGEPEISLLRDEYNAELAQLTFWQRAVRSSAVMGMFAALGILCGIYVAHRVPRLFASMRRFAILAAIVTTVAVCLVASRDEFRAELIPLLLFGMTVAIAYQQELALLLSAAVALIVVIGIGQGLAEFVILLSGVSSAILLMDRIRSRSKLIYVGLCSGVVVSLTAVGVGILDRQPLDSNHFELLKDAGRVGMWAVVAGFLMTGLLPFIEKMFNVLTDISLLELGDVAHPLLQELVRRAPGTYNHSINVASIAEAAAESIGARGLLVRVGAYFHDIGKMLKPQYFAENQGVGGNRHETLVPTMSTLIIIAHIKDGADLARQHHLPPPIVDFILQHHGTTLVEYFYHRANMQSEADPHGTAVQESSFRYPGPKPQSKEAGVLMLADAVESACRTLVGPTPARIEGLVHDLMMKRLLDGQFDESGLTLQELHTVEESLVKSLTAVYHGRVKYPDQRTA